MFVNERNGQYLKDIRKRNRKRRRKKRFKKVLATVAALVIATAALVFAVYMLNGFFTEKERTDVSLCLQGDKLTVTWRDIPQDGIYRISKYDDDSGEYVFCGNYVGNNAALTGIEAGKEVSLHIQRVRQFHIFGRSKEFLGKSKTLTVTPVELACPVLRRSVDTEQKTVNVRWDTQPDVSYEIYLMGADGGLELCAERSESSYTLDVEKEELLSDGQQAAGISVRAVRRLENCVLYSPMSAVTLIRRSDMAESKLELAWEQTGERQYALHWQAGRGDWYEIQQWSDDAGAWVGKAVFSWTDELWYETGTLPSCTDARFRVISYNSEEERDREEFAAEPSEVSFRTGISPLYCTIWPIKDLEVTESAYGGNVIGQAAAGQSLCVLSEEEDRFYIRFGNQYGYVDARYCMIDLSEYLGTLCEYDITNSYNSIFRVHEYDIPEITGSVIKGYENIRLADGKMLVPFLYPCAKKLYSAALAAQEDGYRLRIYDAFRPNEATRYLYDTVNDLMDDPVPGAAGAQEPAAETQASPEPEITEEELSAAWAAAGFPEDFDFEAARAALSAQKAETASVSNSVLTYRKVMTDNRFGLGSFLAQAVSAHNRGLAVDLTLVDEETDETLAMQTQMHDLSWYATLARNNENADLLASYMKGVGFNDLSSEWWHFQDDTSRNELNINMYLTKGVSPEGWKRDDTGWKYRLADGSFYQDTEEMIEGENCRFNADGYLISEN